MLVKQFIHLQSRKFTKTCLTILNIMTFGNLQNVTFQCQVEKESRKGES